MNRVQVLASALIAFHLVALTSRAVPAPEALDAGVSTPALHTSSSGLAPRLFDAALKTISLVEPALYNSLGAIRSVTRPYLAAGLDQQWKMFSRPYVVDQYVRVDSYSRNSAFRELVLPASDESRIRRSHDPRDKAILYTLEQLPGSLTASPEGATDLTVRTVFEPLTRYFGARAAKNLLPGERQQRVEVWYGAAPIPPPGQSLPVDLLKSRLERLAPYRQAPAPIPARPPLNRGTTEREDDISWTLLFVDER